MITILITGCGGAIGLSVVKALRSESKDLRLIGVDSDPYAACFYLRNKNLQLEKSYVVPKAERANYIPEIVNICKREDVNVIFPCTDAELEKLAREKNNIVESGTEILVSPFETIQTCRDKWLTHQRLHKYLPIVASALPDIGIEEALRSTGLPAFIKPRWGWGSRQTYTVQSIEEARVILNFVQEPIIQKWLDGEEYTIDGLADRYGKVLCIVPRKRIKVLAGLSFEGITVRDGKLIKLGEKIARHLRIVGPFNFQVRMVNGKPKIFEINPRFAGTGILSVNAGANIPLLAIRDICGLKVPAKVDFVEGVIASRYFEEVFFKREDLKSNES